MGNMRSLSIRIDDNVRKKLHYVARYEAHTANSHILYLIRKNIEDYERRHGIISMEDLIGLEPRE